ncbi:MAG: site-2 protease family protein [Myxococcales bacterium]|nr:site-2 protease family protein [Myxococcales bacterium]
MDFNPSEFVLILFTVIFSITVHEFAHAWMANLLGDDTAARMGRLTLNPLPLMQAHLDTFVVLPILGALQGYGLGMASTPVTLTRVHRRWKMWQANALISAAGPVSNLLIAVLCAALLGPVPRMISGLDLEIAQHSRKLILVLLHTNITLFLFNLLPVPPLDGFQVLFSLLPRGFDAIRQFMEEYRFILFIAVFVLGGRLIGPLAYTVTRFLVSALA